MPRKGENIRKRKDGRWEARYEKCRDHNGRIQYGYLYGRTYEAVKKKKLAVLCQNNLQNSPGKCYVFRNLSEEWMLSMRYAVKLSTYACYETLLDTHILPEFGDMPLKYISSASVYAFSEKLKQQGLSPRTIKNLLILFHSILRYGEKQGYLNLSQLEFRYPKINTSPFQLISHEHLTKLITVLSAEDSEFPIGILLCIYTGIRVGELSGIRWEDVDFDKKLLHIRRTISRIKNLDYSGESDDEPKTVLMIGPPKSVSSIRDIPIPDFLLKKMKRIAAEPDSYLLTGTNRKCMEPRNIQRKFQKLLQQCEIPSINIHSLRHAFATRCTEMGFDSKTLSEILGHSSVKITMDIYVHSSIKQKQKCIDNESTMRSNADKKVLQYIEAMNITSKYIKKQHENVQLAFNDYILMHLNIACVRGIFCVNNKENYIKKIEHIKKIINTPVFKDAIKKFHIKNNFSARTLPVFFMKYKLVHIASIIYIVRAYQNYIYEKSRN